MDIYAKQLEDENEGLREQLALAQLQADEIENNKLQVALEMLIDTSLERQKKFFGDTHKNLAYIGNVIDELYTLRVSLPRQAGLTTALPKAALKYFSTVDVLCSRALPNGSEKNIKYHTDTSFLIGRVIECLIVDPWSCMFATQHESKRWDDAKSLISRRIKKDAPFLLILAG